MKRNAVKRRLSSVWYLVRRFFGVMEQARKYGSMEQKIRVYAIYFAIYVVFALLLGLVT